MKANRKLAPNEQSMEILNCCAGSFNVVTTSHIQGGLNEKIVRQALDLIQSRHPRLNSRIVGNLDSLRFVFGAAKIPLRVVYKQEIEQWQEVACEEVNQPIESHKGLVRAVLIIFSEEKRNYLITTLHHAISDGLSTVQLHSEILNYCHKIAVNKIEDNISTLLPLPPIKKLMPKSMQGITAPIKGCLLLLRLQLKLLWYRPKTLIFEKFVPIKLRRCAMLHKKLNQETTTQLLENCRKNKTTVQGALCAAMLLAVAKKIKTNDKASLNLSCSSYVDLRKRLKSTISHEDLGVLASAITTFHTLGANTSFWDLARDVREKLKINLETEDIFSYVLMTMKIYSYALSRPHKAPVTVGLTNIGQINIPSEYGLFKLEEISFTVSQAVFGGVFNAAVTTYQGRMLLNFMFSEPSISQDTMETLVNDVISLIIDACYR